MKYKIGDKVRCIDTDNGRLKITIGNIYVVDDYYAGTDLLSIKRDDGKSADFYTKRFEKVDTEYKTVDECIKLAKSFVGKKVIYDDGSKYTFHNVLVFADDGEVRSKASAHTEAQYEKDGFAVALSSGGMNLPVQRLKLVNDQIEMQISDDYSAIVFSDKVEVGCQTISRAKVEELLKNMKSLD